MLLALAAPTAALAAPVSETNDAPYYLSDEGIARTLQDAYLELDDDYPVVEEYQSVEEMIRDMQRPGPMIGIEEYLVDDDGNYILIWQWHADWYW